MINSRNLIYTNILGLTCSLSEYFFLFFIPSSLPTTVHKPLIKVFTSNLSQVYSGS